MRYLVVKNWQEHQHYKKRNPPWIKLHRTLVEDYAFAALKDKTKAHLILIWVLAAATEGRIPHDAAFIAKRINASETLDLQAMITAGFLIPDTTELPLSTEPKVNGEERSVDASEIVVYIPLNTGPEFPVTKDMIAEFQKIYPDVDIPATLNEVRGWNLANPTKRKTKAGVMNHINRWLAKEQNA